jgi:hypothetical protein
MATEFVIDGDAGYDPDALPPVAVRIDGEVYQAHCPKDSVGLLIAEFEQHQDDASTQRELISKVLRAFLEEEDAEAVMAKVLDMGNRRVSIGYLLNLLEKVGAHYEPQVKARQEEMGLAVGNREQRRAAAKTAAKKTARRPAASRS